MLNIETLTLKHDNQIVLNKLNMSVQKGDIIGLMGPSGSGKSSLLRCIQGFEKYDGNISIKGRVCLIFQDYQLFPHMNVLENITYALQKVEKKSKKCAEEEAMVLLKKLGLESKAYVQPGTLSGGQKQRIAILRAIASKADILLLDEPTSALDNDSISELSDLFRSLNEMGITFVIVSHDGVFLNKVSQKIYKLNGGRIQLEAA
jgi:ABC-type polar amino acid transport system ATPase subunit